MRTIEDLARDYGLAADRQIKTLVQVIDGQLTLVLLRGDHPLADQKLIDATGATAIRPAQPDEIVAALGAAPGSLGAVGVTDLPVIADLALQGRANMATGANTDDVHLTGVDVARDITVGQWADLREVAAGEPCPRCGHALELIQAIEVGHIFKLGRKYTTALGVSVLGPDGAAITPIMGSYGIGVERAMAAIAEVHHDDAGLTWPVQVAPAEVTVILLSVRDEEARAAAEVAVPGPAGRRRGRAARRPGRAARREVQGRRADRHPGPAHRRRPRPGRRPGRGHQPGHRREGAGGRRRRRRPRHRPAPPLTAAPP